MHTLFKQVSTRVSVFGYLQKQDGINVLSVLKLHYDLRNPLPEIYPKLKSIRWQLEIDSLLKAITVTIFVSGSINPEIRDIMSDKRCWLLSFHRKLVEIPSNCLNIYNTDVWKISHVIGPQYDMRRQPCLSNCDLALAQCTCCSCTLFKFTCWNVYVGFEYIMNLIWIWLYCTLN